MAETYVSRKGNIRFCAGKRKIYPLVSEKTKGE